jgi:hypothetical protein
MSVTQTVEIPPSHRLTIDVPREVPAGPVILTFTPAQAVQTAAGKEQSAPEPAQGAQPPTPHTDFSCLLDPNIPTPHTDFLSGILAPNVPTPHTDFSCLLDPNIPTPITDRLSGILAGAGDITREQIREERLRKYL